jgi:hypothetical protein
MTLTDLPIAAARAVGSAAFGSTLNARNARIGADAAKALSATGAQHNDVLSGLAKAFAAQQKGKERAEIARRLTTLGVRSLEPYNEVPGEQR